MSRRVIDMNDRTIPQTASRIRILRIERKLSQSQIAKTVFVSQRTYADYELGVIRIPVDVLIKLAEFYDVDMNYICGVSDDRSKFPTLTKSPTL